MHLLGFLSICINFLW